MNAKLSTTIDVRDMRESRREIESFRVRKNVSTRQKKSMMFTPTQDNSEMHHTLTTFGGASPDRNKKKKNRNSPNQDIGEIFANKKSPKAINIKKSFKQLDVLNITNIPRTSNN